MSSQVTKMCRNPNPRSSLVKKKKKKPQKYKKKKKKKKKMMKTSKSQTKRQIVDVFVSFRKDLQVLFLLVKGVFFYFFQNVSIFSVCVIRSRYIISG